MATATTVSADKEPAVSAKEAKEDAMTYEFMRAHYAGQPKVSIRTREDEWVQVNGFTYIIKGGERVEVPKDIADILEESGRI